MIINIQFNIKNDKVENEKNQLYSNNYNPLKFKYLKKENKSSIKYQK